MAEFLAPDEEVRAALEDILGWDDIARSGQLAKFLSYIVEAKLGGREDGIKAYSIAVDVFGRPPNFDPQADPIVRVQARRLRALLDQYYAEVPEPGPIRIRLPIGRYVPEFERLEAAAPPAAPINVSGQVAPNVARSFLRPERGRKPPRPWISNPLLLLLAALLVVALGVLALLFLVNHFSQFLAREQLPSPPHVTVLEFQNLADDEGHRPFVGGLALELVTDLQLFEDIDVSYGEAETKPVNPAASNHQEGPAQSYILSGVSRIAAGQVQYGIILRRQDSDAVIWSHAVSTSLGEAALPGAIDDVSRAFALVLGSHRGPLSEPAREWLAVQTDLGPIATPYLCRLEFYAFRDSGKAVEQARASQCVNALLARVPDNAHALAVDAALTAIGADQAEPAESIERLGRAEQMIGRAVGLMPTSSFIWEQKARVMEALDRFEQADADYAAALQLNPANDDALAGRGRMLAMTPEWKRGVESARIAITDTPEPPPWYYIAPALNALREQQFALAVRYAETITPVYRQLGPVIAVVAATEAGNVDIVNRYLPQVLEYPQFRSAGIMPRLGRMITDVKLLALIRNGLSGAGVPETALDGPV